MTSGRQVLKKKKCEKKREIPATRIVLLFPHFLLFLKQISLFAYHLICSLQMLLIKKSLNIISFGQELTPYHMTNFWTLPN